MLGWLALVVAALAGLFILFQNDGSGLDPTSTALTAAGVVALLLMFYLATLKVRWDERRSMRIWVIAAILVAAAAGAWTIGKDRLRAVLTAAPNIAQEQASRSLPGAVSVMIRRNADGNFIAQGHINSVETALLIDTGAAAVMLKPSDAEKAGIDVQSLSFTTPVQTANGTVYAAPVRLRSIDIGLLKLEDIEALVAKPGSLNENLLGMSFLRRLSSYDLKGEFLTLRE
jgi:aspartyl protease family protein